ncbi:hypothetical protein FAM09_10300 [Niastella caeni]|uniref:DUF2946 domain-containing protein n=1 Tax=Niastella caeni TaxID=2569763 RepID=A0A4S8HX84_9BACT|nr:hypothetical protein [Niastella caeni]THU40250.1 hypothetical protein FAM09_10300 [Niastella caeni]
MTAIRTYKYFIGAVLLALYTFVATPVQLWHHHKIVHAARQTNHPGSNHDLLTQGNESAQDANCSVCSHKYAAYNDHSIAAFEKTIQVTGTKNGYYQLPAVAAPSFPLPNKGPPSIS